MNRPVANDSRPAPLPDAGPATVAVDLDEPVVSCDGETYTGGEVLILAFVFLLIARALS